MKHAPVVFNYQPDLARGFLKNTYDRAFKGVISTGLFNAIANRKRANGSVAEGFGQLQSAKFYTIGHS